MKTPRTLPRRAEILLDFVLLFLCTAVLIRPWFLAGYLNQWSSIESTFIADARFLIAHWPHPQWQPLWYTGTRFDYIYPPALRYGTALVAIAFGYEPVRAYHVYTALFYCLGIAGVYLLIRIGTGSRGAAWLGAAATALMSPSFLILKSFRADSVRLAPLRLGVLVRYGEGPHITALGLIPIALAFTWLALEARRPAAVALAAIFSAAVVSNNFYGGTALALFYALLLWSFWVTRRDRKILLPAIAIPLLAYGLTAFWLVPSYVRITSVNMQYVSNPGNSWSVVVGLVVAAAFAILTAKLGRGRPDRTWAIFTAGCVTIFTLNVVGNYFFHFLITGVPGRWVPELDLVYILCGVGILRWLWNRSGRTGRVVAVVVVLAAFYTTKGFVRHAWEMVQVWPDYQSRVEYRVTDWLWKNMPNARVDSIGSVRFWFDTWHDLAEMGGGAEQGLINGLVMSANWELNLAPQAEASILWMQCLGVDAAYISDNRSEEVYKDVRSPLKYAGLLPLIYDDGQGNTIYKAPRRYPAHVRVVDAARFKTLQTPRGNTDIERLRPYADLMEHGPDAPVSQTWEGTDAMTIRAHLEPDQAIVVQEAYDPAWQAWSSGRHLPVRKDAMGFMVVDAPPGDREIRLKFVMPLENRVGWLLTVSASAMCVWLLARGIRGAERPPEATS